jgi:hypothetical protein
MLQELLAPTSVKLYSFQHELLGINQSSAGLFYKIIGKSLIYNRCMATLKRIRH